MPESKYIDLNVHLVREQDAKEAVELIYTPTQKVVADGLTKALPKDRIMPMQAF
jgi:hypothetical protein